MSATLGMVLDSAQLRLGMLSNSIGWDTQRPVVRDHLALAVAVLDADFADRMRYRPNVLVDVVEVAKYANPESVTVYEIPPDADPFHIDTVSVLDGGVWHVLERGIDQSMRDLPWAEGDAFARWDLMECAGLELWPNPRKPARLRISYYTRPMDVRNAPEECEVDMDPELLILMCLNSAASFYGRPDADSIRAVLNRYLGNIRAQQLKGLRFTKGDRRRMARVPDDQDWVYAFPGRAG